MSPSHAARTLASLFIMPLLACASDPVGPNDNPGPEPEDAVQLLVLNSTGQTLAAFDVGESVTASAALPVTDFGPGFDGVTMDASEAHAVTTVSSFGGSRVLFANLTSGAVQTTLFPAPEGIDANPSRPTFDAGGTIAYVAGRGSNTLYAVGPGDAEASRIVTGVGSFVERLVPVGRELFALDAHLDDDGGTFAPLGPGRIFVVEAGSITGMIDLPPGALNPIDMVRVEGRLLVLVGGTFDPVTFAPNGDGGIVTIDIASRSAGSVMALGGNGVAIEAGADGLAYATSTTDFVTLDSHVMDPGGAPAPLDVRDQTGARVDCWALTGLEDGRRICVTFSFASAGRLLLLDGAGSAIAEHPSGFGSTDVLIR